MAASLSLSPGAPRKLVRRWQTASRCRAVCCAVPLSSSSRPAATWRVRPDKPRAAVRPPVETNFDPRQEAKRVRDGPPVESPRSGAERRNIAGVFEVDRLAEEHARDFSPAATAVPVLKPLPIGALGGSPGQAAPYSAVQALGAEVSSETEGTPENATNGRRLQALRHSLRHNCTARARPHTLVPSSFFPAPQVRSLSSTQRRPLSGSCVLRAFQLGGTLSADVEPKPKVVFQADPAVALQELGLDEGSLEADDTLDVSFDASGEIVVGHLDHRMMAYVGDFVQVNRRSTCHGLIVHKENNKLYVAISGSGKVVRIMQHSVDFVVPGFAAQHFPGWDVPRLDRSVFRNHDPEKNPVLSTAQVAVLKRYVNEGLSVAYRHVLQLDDVVKRLHEAIEGAEITTGRVAMLVFGELTPLNEFATSLYMNSSRPSRYLKIQDPHLYKKFFVRPKEETELIERMHEKVRTKHNDLLSFLEKSAAVLRFSDGLPGEELPDFLRSPSSPAVQFTETDREFLTVMRMHLAHENCPMTSNPVAIVAPAILKPLHRYEVIDEHAVADFLRRVGVFAPWEEWRSHVEVLRFKDEVGDDHAAQLASAPPLRSTVGLNVLELMEVDAAGFYKRDACSSLRHDFGDLPAYAIDDASTRDVDDAVSFERDSSTGDAVIHVHIADPTAYLSPTSYISRTAQARMSSLYLADRAYHMLPAALATGKLGLAGGGAGHASGKVSDFVVTTTVRLAADGTFADLKIRPAVVHNVKRVTYDEVDAYLAETFDGSARPPVLSWPPRRSQPSAGVPKNSTTAGPKNLMRELQREVSKFTLRRFRNGGFVSPVLNSEVKVELGGPDAAYLSPVRPTFRNDEPIINMTTDAYGSSPARELVADLMVLTGCAAAEYCSEHDIPCVYRRQELPGYWDRPDSELSAQERNLRKAYRTRDRRTGQLANGGDIICAMAKASVSVEPGRHFQLGLDAYARASSPLRRYFDMVLHWQIKAHMLAQSSGGGPTRFPFDRAALNGLAEAGMVTEARYNWLESMNRTAWVLEMVRRLDAAGEGASLRDLRAFANRDLKSIPLHRWDINGAHLHPVRVPAFGNLRAQVVAPEGALDDAMESGNEFPVRLGKVVPDSVIRLVLA